MRIVIVGQKWLAAELLKQCIHEGHQVLAAICPPIGVDGEYDRLFAAAQQLGIPAICAHNSVKADAIPECDVILAAHAHAFIPRETRSKATLGAIGYHPSLLPRHRGRDAVRWVLHMREPITGGTIYRLDDGADTGPVLAQDWCHVRPGDTAQTIWCRDLAPMGLRLFSHVLTRLSLGDYCPGVPQIPELATWEPGLTDKLLSG